MAATGGTSVFRVYEGIIILLLSQGRTYEEVSAYLREQTGRRHGLSPQSLRRYCTARGIRTRGRVTQEELDCAVRMFVQRGGYSYGRRMMHGMLTSQGIQASQRRVGESLKCVAPIHYGHRCREATLLLNPVPYRATYFGEKIHLDVWDHTCSSG